MKRLLHIGEVADGLTSVFVDRVAVELRVQLRDNKPSESLRHSEISIRKVLYKYWLLTDLYSEFETHQIFCIWAGDVEQQPFAEFNRTGTIPNAVLWVPPVSRRDGAFVRRLQGRAMRRYAALRCN